MRKKLLVSLMYPALLIVLVICLIVFLVTYVVPNFAELYSSMQAQLPDADADPDRHRHHRARLRAVRVRRSGRGGHRVPGLGAKRPRARKRSTACC